VHGAGQTDLFPGTVHEVVGGTVLPSAQPIDSVDLAVPGRP
jgi:hypothetical protein